METNVDLPLSIPSLLDFESTLLVRSLFDFEPLLYIIDIVESQFKVSM